MKPALSPGPEEAVRHKNLWRTAYRDRWRGACHGIVETGAQVFVLIVAIRVYELGSEGKALLAGAGSIGMLLTPLSLFYFSRLRLSAAGTASLLYAGSALFFAGAALSGSSGLFILFCLLAAMFSTQTMPLMVQIYSENYPGNRRGQLLSISILLSVATAGIFSYIGGKVLDVRLEYYPFLLCFMAVAALVSAISVRGMPSRAMSLPSSRRNPYGSLSHAWKDRTFGWILIVWMVMGIGNLIMLPLRVEYMANPQYGINATNMQIALVTLVLPAFMRLLTTHAWGIIFDRYNFIVVRSVLNGLFLVAILIFFHSTSILWLGVAGSLFGLAMAGGNIAWNLWVTKYAPAEKVSEYMSVHTFFTGLRGTLSPFLGFYALIWLSPAQTSWIAAGLILLSIIMLDPVRRTVD